MSAQTVDPSTTESSTESPRNTMTPFTPTAPRPDAVAARKPVAQDVKPIPMTRIVGVELTKMFNTRAGFWLLSSIGIIAVLASAAVIAFAPDEAINFGTFGSALGVPMSVLLPVIAILSVTSEWSQRNGLTTFTLVPHRGKVILAKAICSIGIGLVGMAIALGFGALGNLLGAAIVGIDPVWNLSVTEFCYVLLASVLGLMMGFTLGILLRNSAGAIVAYFVYAMVLPTILSVLGMMQDWFADAQPWVDFYYSTSYLYEGHMTGERWAQMATSGTIWLLVPLAIGLWLIRRSEVK